MNLLAFLAQVTILELVTEVPDQLQTKPTALIADQIRGSTISASPEIIDVKRDSFESNPQVKDLIFDLEAHPDGLPLPREVLIFENIGEKFLNHQFDFSGIAARIVDSTHKGRRGRL